MMRHRWFLACLALSLMPVVGQAGSNEDAHFLIDGPMPGGERIGAQGGDPPFMIDWSVITGGGGVSHAGDVAIYGSIGQFVLGLKDPVESDVLTGFWSLEDLEFDDEDESLDPVIGLESARPEIGLGDGVPIRELSLAPVSPNPSLGTARVSWEMPLESRVRLTVHDVQGRLVTLLADGDYRPGRHRVAWQAGGGVPSGIYFVRLQVSDRVFVRRVVLAH